VLNDTDRQTDKSRAPILLEVGARRLPLQEARCRTFGQICLRVMHLFRTGATDAAVIATLVCEFQAVPMVHLTQAMDRGRQLHRALAR